MPTTDYFAEDGTKLPGTTTILGRMLHKPALVPWAYKRGKDGLSLYRSRDEAAEAGTLAHDLIEQKIQGAEPSLPEDTDEAVANAAWRGYEGYARWADVCGVEYVATEVSLVSEKFRFGGTLDAVARGYDDRRLMLLDWKTSNALYADNVFQLAAYWILVEENYPEWGPIAEFWILRFDKRDASFHHHSWGRGNGTVEKAREAFVYMRRAYDFVKAVEKVVR